MQDHRIPEQFILGLLSPFADAGTMYSKKANECMYYRFVATRDRMVYKISFEVFDEYDSQDPDDIDVIMHVSPSVGVHTSYCGDLEHIMGRLQSILNN